VAHERGAVAPDWLEQGFALLSALGSVTGAFD